MKKKVIMHGESPWGKTISEVKKYIIKNITAIASVEQVIEKFEINHRNLSSEFRFKTGKCIREFVTDTRYYLITSILNKKMNTGNYYKVARDCGLKNESSLAHFIKRKTGKTTIEFHTELINL